MFNWNAWRVTPEDPAAASTGAWGDAAERLAAQVAASHKQLVGLMQHSFGSWSGAASVTNPFAAWANFPYMARSVTASGKIMSAPAST